MSIKGSVSRLQVVVGLVTVSMGGQALITPGDVVCDDPDVECDSALVMCDDISVSSTGGFIRGRVD